MAWLERCTEECFAPLLSSIRSSTSTCSPWRPASSTKTAVVRRSGSGRSVWEGSVHIEKKEKRKHQLVSLKFENYECKTESHWCEWGCGREQPHGERNESTPFPFLALFSGHVDERRFCNVLKQGTSVACHRLIVSRGACKKHRQKTVVPHC